MWVAASRVRVIGPLAPFAPGFVSELERMRYAPSSAYHQVRVMARMSAWLAGEGLEASDLTPTVIARFAAELGRSGYRNARSSRGVGTLLGYLRRVGAVPAPASLAAAPMTGDEELLDRYQRYLIHERGVCEQAADGYISKVRRFLGWRASAGGVGLEGLTAADVSAFVLAECPRHSTHWGRHLTLSLRSLLVFLHLDGVLEESLAWAVPRVAGWRLAGLPRPLEPGVAQRLVESCDRDAVIGRRDVVVLLLLWRLALRRGEVAAMTLDDLDWRAGELLCVARAGGSSCCRCRGTLARRWPAISVATVVLSKRGPCSCQSGRPIGRSPLALLARSLLALRVARA